MSTLIELTAQIVSAHAGNTQMTSEELFQHLHAVHASLKALDNGSDDIPGQPKQLTIKQAFKKDEVICMVCGQGFKTLKRHLSRAHDLKPGQYRKQFNIPSSQSLAAKSYSDSRRQSAIDRGLSDVLAKARATRAAKSEGKKSPVPAVKTKAPVPAVKVKAPVPAVKTKPAVPAVKTKAAVPAVKVKAALPTKIQKATSTPKTAKGTKIK